MSRISKGFTLVEVLLVSLISGALIALVVTAYLAGAQLFDKEISRTDLFWSSQQALETITANLRECQAVTEPGLDRLTCWWRDLNGNASLESDELLTYSLSAESLLETWGSAERGLVNSVSSLVFMYNDAYDPKLVTIVLTLNEAGTPLTSETSVRIRNR
jgi:prepilin-type N-terminal cleavage/methylation domain-containing protein